jgi:hypothetical protein
VTVTLLTLTVVGYATVIVYHDTYDQPPAAPEDTACRGGIHRIYRAFTAHFAGDAHNNLATLDRDLLGLRSVCVREGDTALMAYRHLERWRYKSEALARFGRDMLDEDSREALAYPGTESSR